MGREYAGLDTRVRKRSRKTAESRRNSTIRLDNVAYCPDLLCSLVSFRLLRRQGLWWDTRSEPTAIKRTDNTVIAELQELYGQWVLEYNPMDQEQSCTISNSTAHAVCTINNSTDHAAYTTGNSTAHAAHKGNSRTKRRLATAAIWHKRLGHPGPNALEHLVQRAEGVRIKGIPTVKCDACGKAKSRRQIRREPRPNNEGPGERIAIDFHDYEAQSFSRERSQMLVTDRYSGHIWDFYFKDNRPARSVIKVLSNFVLFMTVQFSVTVKVIESDNEIVTVKAEVERWCTSQGIKIEPSAPDTQAQNGGAERSGGVIKEKARAMRLDANLPWEMWPEVTRAAVYLYNRTPNYKNQWRSPYEVFFTTVALLNGIVTQPRKPSLGHLKAYGCKAFAMSDDTRRGKSKLQRLDPKAWIGYLVGYRSTNIWRVWIPSLSKVISIRDVIFDEDTVFSGKTEDLMDNLMHSTLEEIAAWVRSVELPINPPNQIDMTSYYEDETITTSSSEPSQNDEEVPGYYQGRKVNYTYPSPPTTPPPVALLAQLMTDEQSSIESVLLPIVQKANNEFSPSPAPSARTRPWAAAFMAGTQAGRTGKYQGHDLDKAQVRRMLAKGIKPYRSQLPPLPTIRTKLEDHPMGELFREAEREHLASHHKMNSWSEVPQRPIKQAGHQILDCMWVYTYKLNKHHQFLKCKARLVVRGDQQKDITMQDTYAATLASRSFRMLMAIAARHDLELKQYDVANAFVHAPLDREVYMRMPAGYQRKGTILKLQKALYGLRISPKLWQREFTTTLQSLGFITVPHEPCCVIKDGVIIFFYVDDIIIAYHKTKEAAATEAVNLLQQKYTMTGGNDLQWFLGVEVIRKRDQHLIQLSQSSYVDKIQRLVDKTDCRHDTPMAGVELKPRTGLASQSQINMYQRKIGSLLFAAVTTRPDIAFATSRLARFLANPGQEHHDAADRVLLYLSSTKQKALQLGGGDHLQIASDASFADNTLDRKSSQGYAIKLFNGLIAWRANKQDTVTTSTTEAELLALSQVAKEAIYISRLLKELGIKLPSPTIIIQCDNKQTIRLVTEEVSKLQTKLRHVDIHNHWLRQEVSAGTITVEYARSDEMIADGLTKVLPANKWNRLLDQLGLVDAISLEVTNTAPLDEIQDYLNQVH